MKSTRFYSGSELSEWTATWIHRFLSVIRCQQKCKVQRRGPSGVDANPVNSVLNLFKRQRSINMRVSYILRFFKSAFVASCLKLNV
ncbi:hypothetical protein L596_028679 [Steinernema carpocapsae]|uniref:Uncharacterized protein n=1 Tax=Steinernema carpocapsae TaxID=34508 RepID=A0A4U5LZ29_STECR|nr:hypothetical protein L596_028679 [Steinernema carpocapsae]